MVNGVSHAGLGRQVDYDIKVILLEKGIDEGLITDGAFDKDVLDRRCDRNGVDLLQSPLLQAYFVVVVHVIERHNRSGGECLEKANHKIRADKAGGAGYEDGFIV